MPIRQTCPTPKWVALKSIIKKEGLFQVYVEKAFNISFNDQAFLAFFISHQKYFTLFGSRHRDVLQVQGFTGFQGTGNTISFVMDGLVDVKQGRS